MERSEILRKFDEAAAEVVACRNDWANWSGLASPERKQQAEDRLRSAEQSKRWWYGELCRVTAGRHFAQGRAR